EQRCGPGQIRHGRVHSTIVLAPSGDNPIPVSDGEHGHSIERDLARDQWRLRYTVLHRLSEPIRPQKPKAWRAAEARFYHTGGPINQPLKRLKLSRAGEGSHVRGE